MKRFLSMLAMAVLVLQSVTTSLVYATDFADQNEESESTPVVETVVVDDDEGSSDEVIADLVDVDDSVVDTENLDLQEAVDEVEDVSEEALAEDETPLVDNSAVVEENPVVVTSNAGTSEQKLGDSKLYPAAEFVGHDGLIQVTASAEKGIFPEGTTMKVSQITTSEAEDIAKEELGDNVKAAIGVDISFRDVEGNEIEPKNAQDVHVSVSLINRSFVRDMEDANLTIVHQDNDGNTQSIENVDVDKGYSQAKAEFDHNHFSIFVFVISDFKLINFKNGSDVITGVYLKDGTEASSLIFDPGVGTLGENEVFLGWTTGENYTTESTPMSIADVQSYISGNFETLGSEIDIYAMVFNRYIVRYHDEGGIVFDTEEVPYKDCGEEICEVEYIINHDYETNNEEFNLLGWKINNEGDSIENGDSYTLTGDLDLWADVEQGHWLVFDENGKGGTYNAPQFVEINDVTQKPSLEMKRFGYSFSGWYTDPECTEGNEFSFGSELTEKTTIYAKWTPNEKAGYTVIFWTQNLERKGYEVADSYVVSNGTVGDIIHYDGIDNSDEDYVIIDGTTAGHYTGFCLTEASKNQEITITPEGDAVLNLYYDRINYNFKFYLYRDGTQRNKYDYANNSNTNSNLNGLVTWHENQNHHPSVDGYTIQSEIVDGRTYYYFVMNAFYGEDISKKWPTYDKISGADGREPVSYVMMVGTKLKPRPSAGGDGTVKGVIPVLDENILGATNNTDGNYVVVRFPDTSNSWRYHIWFEAIDGEDYSDKETKEYDGKSYYEDTIMEVRSSNTNVNSQNEPKYNGFDFVGKKGQNWDANNVTYWTDNNQYHLNFIYNRQQHSISYFDGQYVDGDGNKIQNRASHLLHTSDSISQGAKISAEYKNYKPELPEGEKGYVFEGWYLDEGCTTPYTFTTMPVEGIIVYAKWRQIQYRVFLHPNVPADEGIDWGSDAQKMTFRRSYGDKIDTPTGIRSGYVFVGWYQDAGLTKRFNSDFVLNEDTVKTSYNKTSDFTDPMDKWGNGATWNSDAQDSSGNVRDRFWITKKFDLYAKWSKVLVGASGVNLVYVDEDGETVLWSDNTLLYTDQSVASALQAPSAPAGKMFESWIVQEWNESEYVDTEEEVYPGLPFTIDVSKAKFEKNDQCESEEENCNKYVMQLRAKYVDEGKPETTTIQYFDGSELKPDLTQTINVNEEFTFAEALIKAGNEFLGWTDGTNTYTGGATGYAADNKGVEEGKVNMLYAKWKCEGDEHLNEQGQCVDKVEKACTGDIAEGQVATNATGYVRWDDSINDWAEAPVCELVCDEEKGYHDDNGSCVREKTDECTMPEDADENGIYIETGAYTWNENTEEWEAPVCEFVECAPDYHLEEVQNEDLVAPAGFVVNQFAPQNIDAETTAENLVCVPNTKEETCTTGEVANGHYVETGVTATWENGKWNIPACTEIECDKGFHLNANGACEKDDNPGGGGGGGGGSAHYSCKGEVPANAESNNDLEPSNSSTSYSYSTNKGDACTFQCKSGYTRNEKDGTCDKSGGSSGGGRDDDEEIELGGQVSDKCSVDGTNRSEEEIAAYLYACENDITTIRDINKARLGDFLTRAEMAKMVSVFATKELGMKPNTSKDCSNFANSISTYNQEMKDYMVMSCQLELMGIHTVNYEPIPDFMPSKRVSRAEFGTVLSRVLRGNKYEGTNSNYYINHLNALKENNIITNINPNITEYRAWVFLMLYRAVEAIKVLKSTNNVAIDQQVNEELQEEGKAETGLVVEYDSGSVVPDMATLTESGTLATGAVAKVESGNVAESQIGATTLTGEDASKEVSAETGAVAETGSTSD